MTNISFNKESELVKTDQISEINPESLYPEHFFSEGSTRKLNEEIIEESDEELELKELYESRQYAIDEKVKLNTSRGTSRGPKRNTVKSKGIIRNETRLNSRKSDKSNYGPGVTLESIENKMKSRRKSHSRVDSEPYSAKGTHRSISSGGWKSKRTKNKSKFKSPKAYSQRKLNDTLEFSTSCGLYLNLVKESKRAKEDRSHDSSDISGALNSKRPSNISSAQTRKVWQKDEIQQAPTKYNQCDIFKPRDPSILRIDLEEIVNRRIDPNSLEANKNGFYEKGLKWKKELKEKQKQRQEYFEKEEQKMCPFKPEITESSKKINKTFVSKGEDFYESNMIWKQNLNKKLHDAYVYA